LALDRTDQIKRSLVDAGSLNIYTYREFKDQLQHHSITVYQMVQQTNGSLHVDSIFRINGNRVAARTQHGKLEIRAYKERKF